MENKAIAVIIDVIRVIFPIFMAVIGWYIWSLKQKFVSKQELIKYEEKHKQVIKMLEININKQNEEIREIKIDAEHYGNEISSIKSSIIQQEIKINKQSEDMREIKADIKHIVEAIKDIKVYLFKRRG